MQELKHAYPSVEKDGGSSYGGNQAWYPGTTMRRSGCGVVAAMDLLLYLHRNREGCRTEAFSKVPKNGPIPLAMYNLLSDHLRRKYFLVIPCLGMNGLTISAGLNGYFRSNHLPLRANWAVWGENIWENVEQMLLDDLPVILAIGQNAPFFWMKHKVRLYGKVSEEKYQPACAVKAHYVTITGMDQCWLRVSSWGKEYYINREELERYIQRYSSYLFSNIVFLKKKE